MDEHLSKDGGASHKTFQKRQKTLHGSCGKEEWWRGRKRVRNNLINTKVGENWGEELIHKHFCLNFVPCLVKEGDWQSVWVGLWQPAKVNSPQLPSEVTKINLQINKSDIMQIWKSTLKLCSHNYKRHWENRTGSIFSLPTLSQH